MDWTPSEMQTAITELSGTILRDSSDPWAALVEAQLLDLESLLDVATLLVEVGKTGAKVPAFASLILGAPVAKFGQARSPGTVLTAGLIEEESVNPRSPKTVVKDGFLFGEKVCVPAVDKASELVVPAQDGVYLARLDECEVCLQQGTDDDTLGVVRFEKTPAERLGGVEVLDWWLPRVDVGLCAIALGLSETALALTSDYLGKRKQFGRLIGQFQAVQQRAADAWIQTQVMQVTLWQAAWRVEQGLSSERECAIARYWASEGSHFVCSAAQHLHGGFGFDRDYELHRYFLAAKQHEFMLGGANSQLERLGALVAAGLKS